GGRSRRRPGAPALPESAAARSRRGAAPLSARPRAGDESRAARPAVARRVSRRRDRLQQDPWAAIQGFGDRGGLQGTREGQGGSGMSAPGAPEATRLTKKDFVSDQDVRWCPGCGDYAILSQVQKVLPELGVARENFVFISGIGCSSRFPYYVNTY